MIKYTQKSKYRQYDHVSLNFNLLYCIISYYRLVIIDDKYILPFCLQCWQIYLILVYSLKTCIKYAHIVVFVIED